MATEIGNGVSIQLCGGLTVEPAASESSRRRRSRAGAQAAGFDVGRALSDADFDVLADVVVSPGASRRRRRSEAAEPDAPPVIEVDLAEGEDAVLLIEQQGGVLRWQWPKEPAEEKRQRRSGGGTAHKAVFDLRPQLPDTQDAPSGGGRRRRSSVVAGWIADKLIEPVRVRVLRYLASEVIDLAVEKIEGHLEEGPRYWDKQRASWETGQPEIAAGAKVLLMVHGTFSSTEGSFGGLAATEQGRTFMQHAEREYDAIIGFDHKTLGKTPMENAADMKAGLGIPAGAKVSSVAFSRGGLVLRAFELQMADSGVQFGRAVFVGCTNSGTYLAHPENWRALVDLYTTIAVAAVRGLSMATGFAAAEAANFAIKTIGKFVKLLPELAVEEGQVPGLQAMRPEGELLGEIATPAASLARYRAIASDFRPRIDLDRGISAEVVEFVVNRVGDRLFDQANDLVVHTSSMSDFGDAGTIGDGSVVHLSADEQIYHTIYFGSDAVAEQLGRFLVDDMPRMEAPVAAAAPPPTPPVAAPPPEPTAPPRRRRRSRSSASAPPPPPAPTRQRRSRSGNPGSAPPAFPTADFADSPAPEEAAPEEAGFEYGGYEADGFDEPMADGAPPDEPLETKSRLPETREYHFAAQIEADPPALTPIKLGVTISPEVIALFAGQIMARSEEGAQVETAKPITIEVTPLNNAQLLTEGTRKIYAPENTETEWFLIEGTEPGAARIQIEARQDTRTLALLLLEPVFVDGASDQLMQTQSFSAAPAGQREPVTLRIYEIEDEGKLLIRYNLESRDPGIGEVNEVKGLPAQHIADFFRDFLDELNRSYDLTTKGYELKKRRLLDTAAITADQILPENVREALWKYRGEIDAIQVIADSPAIPWELLSVTAPDGDDGDEQGRFLAEWGLVRRLPGALWPGRNLDLAPGRARYVIPSYRDRNQDLPFAQQERDLLKSHFPGIQELEADSAEVEHFLRNEAKDCSLLHFACHGSARKGTLQAAGLTLQEELAENGALEEDVLTENAVALRARFGEARPNCLVFLNACEAGREGRHLLTNATGFANSFLRPKSRRGAAAFVGALWEVDDELALVFADTFYGALLGGDTMAGASKKARVAIEQKFDFTWLAYTIYGDPYAKANSG